MMHDLTKHDENSKMIPNGAPAAWRCRRPASASAACSPPAPQFVISFVRIASITSGHTSVMQSLPSSHAIDISATASAAYRSVNTACIHAQTGMCGVQQMLVVDSHDAGASPDLPMLANRTERQAKLSHISHSFMSTHKPVRCNQRHHNALVGILHVAAPNQQHTQTVTITYCCVNCVIA